MSKKKQKLINSVYLKRPVDVNLNPIEGNVITPYFSFSAIKGKQAEWDELNKNKKHKRRGNHGYDKTGWIPEFINTFIRMHSFPEYTNIKNIDPSQLAAVEATVYSRLEGLMENLRTDISKGRPWGCTNYSIKNLKSTHSNGDTKKKKEDTGVETKNGPKPHEPEQLTMDFESSFPDVVVSEKAEKKPEQPKNQKKPRKYKKTIVNGDVEHECKTTEETIYNIRHWQVENYKETCKKIEVVSAAVTKLSEVVNKMNIKLNTVTTMAYNFDKLFKSWKPIGKDK